MPTKQEIYESQIKPLFDQATAIAEENGLNIVAVASYIGDGEVTCSGGASIDSEANGYSPHMAALGMMLELPVDLVSEIVIRLMPMVHAARAGGLTDIANPDGEEAA